VVATIGLEGPPLGVDVTSDGQWSYVVLSGGQERLLTRAARNRRQSRDAGSGGGWVTT